MSLPQPGGCGGTRLSPPRLARQDPVNRAPLYLYGERLTGGNAGDPRGIVYQPGLVEPVVGSRGASSRRRAGPFVFFLPAGGEEIADQRSRSPGPLRIERGPVDQVAESISPEAQPCEDNTPAQHAAKDIWRPGMKREGHDGSVARLVELSRTMNVIAGEQSPSTSCA